MPIAVTIAKHIIRIQKTVLNNALETQALMQTQGERTTRALLDQAVWMPDAGRRLWEGWVSDLETGRTAFQTLMNAHWDLMDGFLAPQDTDS
jgi:hypothetical protein